MRLGMERKKRALWFVPALLFGALAVAGCGVSGGGTGRSATPTPPSVSTILQKASAVKITSADMLMTIGGTSAGKAISGTADIKVTQSPQRYDVAFNLTSDGQQLVWETILDSATNASYTKFSQPAALDTGKWVKSSGLGSSDLFDVTSFTNYKDVKDAKLIGPDTINGVAVWHVTAQNTFSSETANEDLYLAQSDYHPVRIAAKVAGSTAGTFTMDYKSINASSITISLPPADQVQSA